MFEPSRRSDSYCEKQLFNSLDLGSALTKNFCELSQSPSFKFYSPDPSKKIYIKSQSSSLIAVGNFSSKKKFKKHIGTRTKQFVQGFVQFYVEFVKIQKAEGVEIPTLVLYLIFIGPFTFFKEKHRRSLSSNGKFLQLREETRNPCFFPGLLRGSGQGFKKCPTEKVYLNKKIMILIL